MYTIQFYSRRPLFKARQWYWRAVHFNGNIIAWSGEGYFNRQDCKSSWSRFAHAIGVQDYSIQDL